MPEADRLPPPQPKMRMLRCSSQRRLRGAPTCWPRAISIVKYAWKEHVFFSDGSVLKEACPGGGAAELTSAQAQPPGAPRPAGRTEFSRTGRAQSTQSIPQSEAAVSKELELPHCGRHLDLDLSPCSASPGIADGYPWQTEQV